MTYKETVDYLFSQLPIYQRQGVSAYKTDIKNIVSASSKIGNPHLQFKSIHVGGTNGKGSTSHAIASIMQEAGYNVGLYTSPHLKDFRERIKINGKMISKNHVIDFISDNKKIFEQLNMSFFEMTVLMAFNFFAKKKIDIGIIEVGLGGRLDSTNIINPELSIITNISIDHTNILGSSIKKIAEEKAGIIKSKTPVIIGRTEKITKKIFAKKAKKEDANIVYVNQDYNITHESDLYGEYQQENIKTCICAIEKLILQGWNISKKNITTGLKNCIQNTKIEGRWQILSNNPLIICDIAHNEDGIRKVLKQISKLQYKNLHFVIGTVNDKEINTILSLLPKNAMYYFCKAKIERAFDEKLLQKKAKENFLFGNTYSSVQKALEKARENSNKNDLIFVGGSTFVVAEII